MTTTLEIQQRLAALGYSVGPIDGIPGRLTTGAVRAFQMAHPTLVDDGIVGPLTLAALNAADPPAQLSPDIVPPWIENVRQHIGLQEVRDNKKLRDYLDSDGSTVGDPAKIPWCGDLVQTALALTLPEEPLPGNPYWALNWAPWGRAVPAGMVPLGAVGTKSRNGGGHVFFVVGHDATHLHALGGNQSNSICIILIPKADCNGLRWPSTYPMPDKGLTETTIEATINASEA